VSSKEFYLANYSRLFVSAVILDILSVIHNMTFLGLPFSEQIPHFIVLAILIGAIISKNKNTWLHMAIALLLLAILIVVIIVTQNDFLVK
jgi:hypothetical protein